MTRELDWGNVSAGGNKEQAKFIKLQSGDNRVRVVGKPVMVDIHWERGLDGSTKKVVCPGAGCPVCKAGHTPQSRYQVLVIDRVDGEVKVMEGGPRVFGAIRDYAMDPDYGDPKNYDLKIKKEGTGRETKYTVMASPKQTPLTAQEAEAVNAATSLLDLNKPKTIDEILTMGLEVLAGSVSDLDDDFGAAPTGNSNGSAGNEDPGFTSDDWDAL